MYKLRSHSQILLDQSYVPFLASLLARSVLLILNLWFNSIEVYYMIGQKALMNDIMRRRYFFYLRAISALLCFFFWFRLVRSEVRGHTVHMSVSFRNRFAWFLVSEAMLFFRFFWCYFHNTLNVDLVTRRFPNFRVVVLDAWGVPLFNTMVLLSSRFTLTFRHQALVLRFNDRVRFRMIITIIQRIIFTYY